MQKDYFISDIALEGTSSADFAKFCTQKLLSYSITRQCIQIKNSADSHKSGLQKGKYVVYDCPNDVFEDIKMRKYLSQHIARSVEEMVGAISRNRPLLTVGLGNRRIVADSLGEKTIEGVCIDNDDVIGKGRLKRCAIATGVLGTTGLESIEIIDAIVKRINPCAVILVDSLATSSAKRLCSCFQISSNGIRPGSGVGQDKQRIDKSVLGVPTISIGVPMMLSLSTAIYSFSQDYLKEEGVRLNEYLLRKTMGEFALSRLSVSPKDVDVKVGLCATIISDAINALYCT